MRPRVWPGDVALAALVAIPVVPSSLSLLADSSLSTVWQVAATLAVAVLHVAMAARRTWPLASFAFVALAELALATAPSVAVESGGRALTIPLILLPSSVVFGFSLYAVAAYGRRPAPALALAVGVVGAVLSLVRLARAGDDGPADLLSGTWEIGFALAGLLTAVGAAWSLGLFRRMHTAYVEALEDRTERAEAEREERARAAAMAERARIAREMHDIVAHSLAVIVRQADAGRYAARTDPAVADRVLGVIAGNGREALVDMRSMLGVLRTGDGQDASAPQPTLADVDDLLDKVRASGLPVRFGAAGEAVPLERAGELAAYRLAQEALTNVVKHAGTDAAAEVGFAWDAAGLTVTVTDDGGRSAATDPVGDEGHGLAGMRERLHLAGGTLAAERRPGGGFVVRGRIPRRERPTGTAMRR